MSAWGRQHERQDGGRQIVGPLYEKQILAVSLWDERVIRLNEEIGSSMSKAAMPSSSPRARTRLAVRYFNEQSGAAMLNVRGKVRLLDEQHHTAMTGGAIPFSMRDRMKLGSSMRRLPSLLRPFASS